MGEFGKRDYLEDPGVNGRIFSKLNGGGMNWNGLIQDRDR
jgi:hypothetical protein